MLFLALTVTRGGARAEDGTTTVLRFDPVGADRSLPHGYVDQALASLRALHPGLILDAERRHAELGPVRYSLLVYRESAAAAMAHLTGAATLGREAWIFVASCPVDRTSQTLILAMEDLSRLHRSASPDAAMTSDR